VRFQFLEGKRIVHLSCHPILHTVTEDTLLSWIVGTLVEEAGLEVLVEGVAEGVGDTNDLVADVDAVVAVDAADLVEGYDVGAVDTHEA